MDPELERLYREDRVDHANVPPVGTKEYLALRLRDRNRRERTRRILDGLADPDPADLYHAAWLFNHGDDPEEAHCAHELATRAAEGGDRDAKWLAAASFDRWCMYRGLKQKYGTQIVPDGAGYRLWDVEADTTDDERASFGVPPLDDMHRRAERLSREEPQPDFVSAPRWLLDAIERWKAHSKPE